MKLLMTALLLAVGAAPAGGSGTIELRGDRAKVEGEDGRGLFLIGRDSYVFAKIGNPKRQSYAWDPQRKRVRISPPKRDPMWIQCAYLEAIPDQCPARPAIGTPGATDQGEAKAPATKGFSLARPTPSAAVPKAQMVRPRVARSGPAAATGGTMDSSLALPECPGDPRCP